MLMTQFSMHALELEFIDTRVLVPARHLAFTTPLVGEFQNPMDLHVQILKFEACGF